MIDLPIDNLVARLALYVLWAVWASLLVLGFILGKPHADDTRRIPLPARMGMSIVLVLAALIWWLAGTAGTDLASYGRWLFLGMAFGFLGDLFMARLFPVSNEKIYGIAAFAIGHLFYIIAFLDGGAVLGLADQRLGLILIGAYALLGVVLWLLLVRNPAQPAVLNVGTFVYALVISAMSALALALALQEPLFWPLFLGTLSFVTSDVILANQFMRGANWRLISDVVWITYTIGQMLIVYSTAIALRILGVG